MTSGHTLTRLGTIAFAFLTLSAANIEKYCKCTFFGNGNYNPECTGR